MNIHFNTMVKDEGILLESVLPIWKKYPIEKFIFYNDNSTDNTIEVIYKHLSRERVVILNDNLPSFHEAHHRSRMLEYSRENGADFVFSIDADELLSENLVSDYDVFLKEYETRDIHLYWYNIVEGTLNKTRQDPLYRNNYRSFILPIKRTGKFNLELWKYHTPRVPIVDLPMATTKRYGVIHLQAINKRFYALKQLWYNLLFLPIRTPKFITGELAFNPDVYDNIEKVKGYHEYIKQNYNSNLVTFGKEYI